MQQQQQPKRRSVKIERPVRVVEKPVIIMEQGTQERSYNQPKEKRRLYKKEPSGLRNIKPIEGGQADIEENTPIFEKIMRTRFDPAHAIKYARGISSNSKCYVESNKIRATITTVAGNTTIVISIPSLEVPIIYSTDGGATFYGLWSTAVARCDQRINDLRAEAVRSIGKGFKLVNITNDQTKVDRMYSFKLTPATNLHNRCDSSWLPNGASANTDITNFANKAIGANWKVIQNIPNNIDQIAELGHMHEGTGVYLVNDILDNEWRKQSMLSDTVGPYTAVNTPDTTTSLGALRLGIIGSVDPAGGQFVLNNTPAFTMNTRLVSSALLNTDLVGVVLPATAVAQTLAFEGFDHYQIMTSDVEYMGRSNMIDPYDYPDLELTARRYTNFLPGLYPASYNFWGKVWSFIKRTANKVGDFYKDNSKVLKPALSLIPGASTALDIVDKYI